MKTTVGVLAVLLLVSTLALGQSYQPLPFPQEVNTALVNGPGDEVSPTLNAEEPPSMAANQDITNQNGTESINLGSPFPSAANPSADRGNFGLQAPEYDRSINLGSPFPSEANPAHQW